MTFKIEFGVPLVKRGAVRKNSKRGSKYPFAQMKVGTSFKMKQGKEMERVAGAAHNFMKGNPGHKFTVRKIDNKNARCWRIA